MSRACQEAAEAKRANAVLQAQLDQIKVQVQQPIDPQAKEKFFQQLVDDPHQAISRYVSEQTGMAVQQQVKQLLLPVIQSVEQKGLEQAWDAA